MVHPSDCLFTADEQRMRIAYSHALTCFQKANVQYVPLEYGNPVQRLMHINEALCNHLRHLCQIRPQDNRIPVGNWYMLTVTSPAGCDKDIILSHHDKVVQYLESRKIKIYLAGLEETSNQMRHIHYAICSPATLKNEKRDLTALCSGHRIQFERKVRTFRKFQGLLKYCSKDGYDDATQVEMLIEHAHRTEGNGWQLDDI